jgi:hypothetical protein
VQRLDLGRTLHLLLLLLVLVMVVLDVFPRLQVLPVQVIVCRVSIHLLHRCLLHLLLLLLQ